MQPSTSGLRTLTLGDLVTRFRDEHCPHRRGGHVEIVVLNAFLRSEPAGKMLSDLTPQDFAIYRDRRLKSVRADTIIRELGLIQRILELARIEWNIPLPANPVKAIRKPKGSRPRDRRLKPGELDKIIAASQVARNPLLLPAVQLAIATAMRRGELLNARWGHVDWRASTLFIPLTKNGEPRTIPLTEQAKHVLAGVALDWCDEAKIIPLSAEALKLGWQRLTRRAGIDDLHFHDLRHEAVSRFFERGLTVPEVALISGHRDPRMLFRYTHLRAEDLAKKLAAVSTR
jgi:integrase